LREVERLQREKVHDRKTFLGRASCTDPEAHVMRNGEGGTVPSYNVQLVTDTTHGLVVNVEATTDAIDYRQLEPALQRCEQRLGRQPRQLIADGDYTNHASVQAAAARGVDFYGSWQNSWKATERDALGRSAAFVSSAFPYDATQNVFRCPAGATLCPGAILNRGHGVRTHVYRAPKEACRDCALREQCAPPGARAAWRRSIGCRRKNRGRSVGTSLPQIDADRAAGIIDLEKHLSQIPIQPRNRPDRRIERMFFRHDEEHSQDSSHAKCAIDGAEVAVPPRNRVQKRSVTGRCK
jgi:hypothetical protein